MEQEIKVWKVNDCDWMAAATAEEATAGHKELGMDCDDDPAEPSALTEEDMQRLVFQDEDNTTGEVTRRSFREQLDKMIAEGEKFPCFFASTEF
jgi:hypothetical protein